MLVSQFEYFKRYHVDCLTRGGIGYDTAFHASLVGSSYGQDFLATLKGDGFTGKIRAVAVLVGIHDVAELPSQASQGRTDIPQFCTGIVRYGHIRLDAGDEISFQLGKRIQIEGIIVEMVIFFFFVKKIIEVLADGKKVGDGI